MLYFSKLKIFTILAICFFAFILALANFVDLGKLSNKRINLGLDLRGGSHLLLQVDFDYYVKEQLSNIIDELKTTFRKKKVRTIPKLKTELKGNEKIYQILFVIKKSNNVKEVKKIIRNTNRDLDIKISGNSFALKFDDVELNKMKQKLMQQSVEIVRRRIDETGTREPIIQVQGKNRILVQVPGMDNPDQLKNTLGKTAKMTFHFVNIDIRSGMIPPVGVVRMKEMNGDYEYYINKQVILSGDLLTDANVTYHQGEPAVSFQFNSLGARKFAKITRDSVGKLFAVVLDGEVITAPRINTPITGGAGIISGNFTVEEANQVALLLRAGALPAPLEIVEERSVGPSLGQDSIESGTRACLLGLLSVVIFMIFVYRLFGLFANIALFVNICLIMAALSLFGATLTLPGIAGIVLTIGMAVDANVLIFERIKEELEKSNRVILNAVSGGFEAAFKTIFDSNITTLIVAFILYLFGSGPIRGFAVVLGVGILSSMFSAILFTRLLIVLWLNKFKPKEIKI